MGLGLGGERMSADKPVATALDAGYALSVAAAAMLGSLLGPLGAGFGALIVAAGFFVASAWIADHRAEK